MFEWVLVNVGCVVRRLSELRSVKHSRDVTLRQDSEQRQLGMRLLRRDVANLPAEALEELSQAHHTLCKYVTFSVLWQPYPLLNITFLPILFHASLY